MKRGGSFIFQDAEPVDLDGLFLRPRAPMPLKNLSVAMRSIRLFNPSRHRSLPIATAQFSGSISNRASAPEK